MRPRQFFIKTGENMYLKLSPRLQCIADYIRPGDRVIDVGTDHAYIPIYLLQNEISQCVTATDIRPGPLENAAADAKKYQVDERLTLLLCDGLRDCTPEMADTVILAGMGGETIQGILAAAPWALEKRLLLQPQSKQPELRAWLAAQGLTVSDASLVHDTGRLYLVWLVQRGVMPDCAAVEPALLAKRDPLLRPYIDDRIKRLRKQIRGMEAAKAPDLGELAACKAELEALLNTYEEVAGWQA